MVRLLPSNKLDVVNSKVYISWVCRWKKQPLTWTTGKDGISCIVRCCFMNMVFTLNPSLLQISYSFRNKNKNKCILKCYRIRTYAHFTTDVVIVFYMFFLAPVQLSLIIYFANTHVVLTLTWQILDELNLQYPYTDRLVYDKRAFLFRLVKWNKSSKKCLKKTIKQVQF